MYTLFGTRNSQPIKRMEKYNSLKFLCHTKLSSLFISIYSKCRLYPTTTMTTTSTHMVLVLVLGSTNKNDT